MSKSRVDEIKHSNQTPAAEKPTYHADIPTYPRVFEFGLNSGIPAAGVSAPCRLNKTQQSKLSLIKLIKLDERAQAKLART